MQKRACGAILLAIACAGLPVFRAYAQGSLTPPGPPAPMMYSLEDIHDDIAAVGGNLLVMTNALGDMNWSDVMAIQQVLVVVTQKVGAIEAVMMEVDWDSLKHIAHDLPIITNAISGLWHDINAIHDGIASLSNRFSAVEGELQNVRHIVEENNALLHTITNSP